MQVFYVNVLSLGYICIFLLVDTLRLFHIVDALLLEISRQALLHLLPQLVNRDLCNVDGVDFDELLIPPPWHHYHLFSNISLLLGGLLRLCR